MKQHDFALRLEDVQSRAHGRWDEILRCLGVDEAILRRKNMACPLCGGTDRFQYTDRFQEGNYHCRNPDCGPGGGFKLLQAIKGWDFPTTLRQVHVCVGGLPAPLDNQGDEALTKRMAQLAARIWDEASPVRVGDDVDRYLSARGLELDTYPVSLRCHPGLGYYERGAGGRSQRVAQYPAMLARVDRPDGSLCSLHRTYLSNGRRAPLPDAKKLLNGGINGAAVRLMGAGELLAVTEGIETALAVHLLQDVPVWAGLSASNLERLWLPAHVRRVLVFADNDTNFVGQASAYALARRLRLQPPHGSDRGQGQGRNPTASFCTHQGGAPEVEVLVPAAPGADWADVWSGRLRRDAPAR